MNAVLLLFNFIVAALALCGWLSPDFLDKHGRRFHARAAGLRASRAAYDHAFGEVMGTPVESKPFGVVRQWKTPTMKQIARTATGVGLTMAFLIVVLYVVFSVISL